MAERIDVRFRMFVDDILVKDGRLTGIRPAKGEEIAADQVIIAPGRDGSEWLEKLLKRQGLTMANKQVGIGVRVETSNVAMQELNQHLYEAKVVYNSSVSTRVRIFCANPIGRRQHQLRPAGVAHVHRAVQQGDQPPGDLGLVLPYNTMKSLVEMMEALEKVTSGIASEHTLFYGVEAKFYSARPQLTITFETEVAGLFAVGDGEGLTRGLAQAPAVGLHVA